MKKQIQEHYRLNVINISRVLVGAGGQTYLVETESGKYILKVCWEVIRSFTYADPYCKNGEINIDRLIEYVKAYLQYHPLNAYDLKMMPYFFYCQILACDYYGQYYDSSDESNML